MDKDEKRGWRRTAWVVVPALAGLALTALLIWAATRNEDPSPGPPPAKAPPIASPESVPGSPAVGPSEAARPKPGPPEPSPPVVVAPVVERPFRVLVDASKGGGVWWFPQGRDGFDPERPHQGSKLATYLRGRGWEVRELPRGMPDMSGALEDVDLVLRFGDLRPHSRRETAAYQSFVRGGGNLLLLASFRRARKADPVSEAFGVRFDTFVRGEVIGRWADHPVTRGLPRLRFGTGSAVVEYPKLATPLAWLAEEEGAPEPGALVMGTMVSGKGRVVFLSSMLMLLAVPQPFADKLFDFLGDRAAMF